MSEEFIHQTELILKNRHHMSASFFRAKLPYQYAHEQTVSYTPDIKATSKRMVELYLHDTPFESLMHIQNIQL